MDLKRAFIILLLVSSAIDAVEIDTFKLRALEQQDDSKEWLSEAEQTPLDWEAKLNTMPEPEQIYMRAAVLRELAKMTTPSEEVKQWVVAQQKHIGELSMRDIDHPERTITLVDVSNSAHATLYIWQLQNQIREIQKSWELGQLVWSDVLGTSDRISRQALAHWVQRLNPQQAELVAEQVSQSAIEYLPDNNQFLAQLVRAGRSVSLAQLLLVRPADEHSVTMLQSLADYFSEEEVIALLVVAVDNSRLASAALLRLAKDYAHSANVQARIELALDDAKLQWYAAAAMGEIKNIEVKQRFTEKLQSNASAHARYALKQLQKDAQ